MNFLPGYVERKSGVESIKLCGTLYRCKVLTFHRVDTGGRTPKPCQLFLTACHFPALQEQVNSPPDKHSKGGRGTQDNCKDRDDRCIEDEPPQDGSKRGSKDHRQHRTPQLFGIQDSLLMEKSKSRREEEPGNDQREENRSHARQKGCFSLTMGGKADECDQRDRKNITNNKDVFFHWIL